MPRRSGHQLIGLIVRICLVVLFCLTGCAIGEIAGLLIGPAEYLANGWTIGLSVALALLFGYTFPRCRCSQRPEAENLTIQALPSSRITGNTLEPDFVVCFRDTFRPDFLDDAGPFTFLGTPQSAVDAYRVEYHTDRLHQGLDDKLPVTPVERFRPVPGRAASGSNRRH